MNKQKMIKKKQKDAQKEDDDYFDKFSSSKLMLLETFDYFMVYWEENGGLVLEEIPLSFWDAITRWV